MGKKGRKKKSRSNRSPSTPSSTHTDTTTTTTTTTTTSTSTEPSPDSPLGNVSRGGIQIVSVPEQEDGLEFVYSYNHGNGRPEFYMAHVPANKVSWVVKTMNGYSTVPNLSNRHSIRGWNNLLLWLNLVQGPAKDRLLEEKCLLMKNYSNGAPIYEFRLIFPECSPLDSWWGRHPPAPNHKDDALVDHILYAWEEQGKFTLEVNCEASEMGEEYMEAFNHFFGNMPKEIRDNMVIPRRKYVDLTLALKNMDSWKTDWDKKLNKKQIAFVKENRKYFRSLSRAMFRGKPICDHCGATTDLMHCGRCKTVHYCSRHCQLADRKCHKESCKEYQSMRTNELPAIKTTTTP